MALEKNLDKVLADEEIPLVLDLILRNLAKNKNNTFDSQKIIDITNLGVDNEKHHVVTLYLGEEYAQFYDEFEQTALTIPELIPLTDYLINNGWEVNLT